MKFVRRGVHFLRRVARRGRRFVEERLPMQHTVEIVVSKPRDELYEDILRELRERSIPHMTGGRVDELRRRIHVTDQHAVSVAEAIVVASQRCPVRVSVKPGGEERFEVALLPDSARRGSLRAFDIWLTESTESRPDDRFELFSVIEVDLWHRDPTTFKGAAYGRAPRDNDYCTSMRWPTLLSRMSSADSRALESLETTPNLFARAFPIDIVYTWVDDKDSEWLEVKRRHQPVEAGARESRRDHKERYNNRNELMYSLRSLDMFAPWVRNIFIVTMGQVPSWLDTTHPQIRVVDHREIYADADALPTFNSSSIETQLHHIEGLAEHFIYFNDDVFLGKACDWSEFFLANGVSKFFPAHHTITSSAIEPDMEEYLVADKNAIDLISEKFGVSTHRPMAHVPHAVRRSTLYELENLFPDAFRACEFERFRSPRDIRPIAFMAPNYGFHAGTAVPGGSRHRYLALWKPTIEAQLRGVLRSRDYATFCVNDVGLSTDREQAVNALVSSFLDRYFPRPSRFELQVPIAREGSER